MGWANIGSMTAKYNLKHSPESSFEAIEESLGILWMPSHRAQSRVYPIGKTPEWGLGLTGE